MSAVERLVILPKVHLLPTEMAALKIATNRAKRPNRAATLRHAIALGIIEIEFGLKRAKTPQIFSIPPHGGEVIPPFHVPRDLRERLNRAALGVSRLLNRIVPRTEVIRAAMMLGLELERRAAARAATFTPISPAQPRPTPHAPASPHDRDNRRSRP